MRCDASRSKWLGSRSSMTYARRTSEPVWRIQTCRQESCASLSSPVPGIEPIVCAKTDSRLPGPCGDAIQRRETQTVTDDRAQVPNHPGKSGEDLEHRAI